MSISRRAKCKTSSISTWTAMTAGTITHCVSCKEYRVRKGEVMSDEMRRVLSEAKLGKPTKSDAEKAATRERRLARRREDYRNRSESRRSRDLEIKKSWWERLKANPEKLEEYRRKRRDLFRKSSDYREHKRQRQRERHSQLAHDPAYRGRALFYSAKARAVKSGMAFTIDPDWVARALEAGVCQETGIPFSFERGHSPWSPSIDRSDNSVGYTPENSRVVCEMYNRAKSNRTKADLLRMAECLVAKNRPLEGWL